MKIMHVSLGLPPLRTGGLTKYSVDLMLTQRQLLHDVSLIYPGHYTLSGGLNIKQIETYQGIEVYEIINPLPVSLLGGIKQPQVFMKQVNKQRYFEFLQMTKPDVIHLHTLMGIHKEFLEVAKDLGIQMVFTSHDYFGICPMVNLLNTDKTICEDFNQGKGCISCNQSGYSLGMIYVMQSQLYRHMKNSRLVKNFRIMMKQRMDPNAKSNMTHLESSSDNDLLALQYSVLRDYYMEMFALINKFHFNSSTAQRIYSKYGLNKGDVISISHSGIRDQRSTRSPQLEGTPLRITYLGPIDVYKGFYLLKQSLDLLKEQSSLRWQLHVYGDDRLPTEDYYGDEYTFHGRYHYEDLHNIFDQTDVLIVPSIWQETFGFVGMEALSYGVPMLISDHVGFKDMISDGVTGLLFKAEVHSLVEKLQYILENRKILNEINNNIVDMKIDFSMQQHVQEIIQWYPKLNVGATTSGQT